MNIEEIKAINGFSGYYISSDGNVYCDLGRGNRRNGKTVQLYEIKPRNSRNGYTRVYAKRDIDGKRVDLYIHRLVAETFLDNPEGKKYVNHKNCIRNDNRLCNLEWATAKENTQQNRRYRAHYT